MPKYAKTADKNKLTVSVKLPKKVWGLVTSPHSSRLKILKK